MSADTPEAAPEEPRRAAANRAGAQTRRGKRTPPPAPNSNSGAGNSGEK